MADNSNKTTYNKVITALSNFSLSKPAIKVYLTLSATPPLTIQQLASKTKIPRTTIYGLVQELGDLGLIERLNDYKSHRVRAYPVSILRSLIDNKLEQIDHLKNSLDFLNTALVSTLNISTTTEVRYYQGASGLEQMIWNSLKAQGDIVGYSTYGRRDKVGKKFYQGFVEEFARKKIKDRVIINPEPQTLNYIKTYVMPADKQHQQQVDDIRVIAADDLYVSGDTMIYNDTYAIAYWQQGEVIGVEIDNAEFVKSQRSIFELLWKMGKPIAKFLPTE